MSNTARMHRKLLEANVKAELIALEGISHAQYMLLEPDAPETFVCASYANAADTQTVIRSGENKSQPGPDNWFTGKVRVDPLFPKGDNNVNASGAYVTFEPGARSAWHEHPDQIAYLGGK